ncbi:hypothetical protein Scep_006913 [Stephania cephalantha]|uniref:Uncharacterized protein n=1 Tax=Stephania cephalantha TaxID=152367 RepID=A0AAP0K928_9MAGN
MPVLTLFLDYKDAFTPCRPFLSRESTISWLQMIGHINVMCRRHNRDPAKNLDDHSFA